MQGFWSSVVATYSAMDFRYAVQLLSALLPMSIAVVLHAKGVGVVGRCFRRFAPRRVDGATQEPHILLLVAIAGIMLATHFLEVTVWAMFYYLTNLLPNPLHAVTFSLSSYTTLGSSHLHLPAHWRGFEGFEALTAMLMFGWSTAVLATVVRKLHTIDE